MSKFSNLLKLIILLKSKKRMKTKELAEALGVGERMIRKYIADLSEANIIVDSITGPNGGYELEGYDYLLSLDISKQELSALQVATQKVKDEDSDLYINLESLGGKISTIYENKISKNNHSMNTVIQPKVLDLNSQTEKEIELQAAIIRKNKIEVTYYSVSSGETKRILRPYEVITRNNHKYLVAYCENRNKILIFKLLRISKIEHLEEKFNMQEDFNINFHINNQLGIFNDEELNIKLMIRKPFSQSISEGIYADNQQITWNDDGSIIFEGKMSGKTDIIRWILSMRDAVTVLEPKSLKEEIRDELIKMLSKI
jgi:predicted DNA-binding transcriptional regulator YafY